VPPNYALAAHASRGTWLAAGWARNVAISARSGLFHNCYGTMSVQQNDPAELLEVFDSHGQPTGMARSRAEIHLNGDWHQAFHCWIVRRHGREVVLQRRSLEKDTFPGCWDAAAAGQWRFGETPKDAAREIAEELGLAVDFDQLVYRGHERAQRRYANGLIDREYHRVYVLESDLPIGEYRPDPAEVMGVAAFSVPEVISLAAGRVSSARAIEGIAVLRDGSLRAETPLIAREEVVPYSAARLRRMLGWGGRRSIQFNGYGRKQESDGR
jgi:isopentenyldiphosphate isomerase